MDLDVREFLPQLLGDPRQRFKRYVMSVRSSVNDRSQDEAPVRADIDGVRVVTQTSGDEQFDVGDVPGITFRVIRRSPNAISLKERLVAGAHEETLRRSTQR